MPFCTSCGSSVEGKFCPKCGTPIGAQPAAPAPAQPAAVPPPFAPQPTYEQQPGYAAPPPAKKSNMIFYVLGGCLGLVVIGILIVLGTGLFVAKKVKDAGFDPDLAQKSPGVAIVKMMAAMNPDAEVVSVDEKNQKVTLREKSTGKTITINLDDVKKGNISFSDEKGETSFSAGDKWKPPSWVPSYPGASTASGGSSNSPEQIAGVGSCSTSDSADMVVDYYESALKREGFEVTKSSISSAGLGGPSTLTAKDTGRKRELSITATPGGGKTQIAIVFSEKK